MLPACLAGTFPTLQVRIFLHHISVKIVLPFCEVGSVPDLSVSYTHLIGENREPIRLTTKPEPYTLQKALHWLQRQVAPTIKMVQALDRENHTTILKDMIEQAELKDKHKHLLQLEKSTIEERIDTAVPQENDGIF